METLEIVDFSSCIYSQKETEDPFYFFSVDNNISYHSDDLLKRLDEEMNNNTIIKISEYIPENKLEIKNNIINGTYVTDLNILYIDQYIVTYLSDSSKKLEQSKVQYSLIKDRLESEEMTIIEFNSCKKKLLILENEIHDIKNNIYLERYKEEVEKIIKEYQRIGIKRTPISFDNNEDEPSKEDVDFRRFLVKSYLEKVNKYHTVNVQFIQENQDTCSHCQSKNFFTNSDLLKQCINCNYVITTYSNEDNNVFYKKYYTNTDIDKTIQKKLDKIQGKGDKQLPEDLFELLDNYFYKIGFPLGDEIKTWDLDTNGMRVNLGNYQETNIGMMREALRKNGYNKFYDETYKIAHEYWGWELHDLCNLEELIKSTYINTINFIQDIKGDRTSDCNSEYWFFRVLEQVYHPLNQSYFNIIKTEKSREYHDFLWFEVCKSFGWEKPKPI